MNSCLYRGRVRHRRSEPEHQFSYSTSWIYLDLDEVDQLLASRWLLSGSRFSPASFLRADHFGDHDLSVKEAALRLVEQITGTRPNGPVRALTQLRHFGIYFSPLNVIYCFDDDGDSPVAVVAEVSNTPWNERHCYVLWEGNRLPNSLHRYAHPKSFHVSPFMGMDSEYQWRVGSPGTRLGLSIGCCRDGQRLFHADLHLTRAPLTDGQLARSLLRRPVAAVQILGAIYYQALRLWIKKCQFYPHPQTLPASSGVRSAGSRQPMRSELPESR